MNKLFIPFLFALISTIKAQPPNNNAAKESTARYYRLGLKYKDGVGVSIDYTKAVGYFQQAANLGDAQSIYALAYMYYKGLGCGQDYVQAATLFKSGAIQGKENSMYFYGLCWRNGYGIDKNIDSANYWLQKSANLGYAQAQKELKAAVAENSNDAAKKLVTQIHNEAMPNKFAVNSFQKIENHLPSSAIITGRYIGYLIQYDWSGQNIVSSKKLSLSLTNNDVEIKGNWLEEDLDSVALNGKLENDSIFFYNTQYGRNDHYSQGNKIRYDFKKASVNFIQKNDTIFLAGNIEMFSPDRREPAKPIFIALSRTEQINTPIDFKISVLPNPFTTTLNVGFTIQKDNRVVVQLLNEGGALVYKNDAGVLSVGSYVLPLKPGYLSPGFYLVKIICGNSTSTVKVLKE